jgi:hypothetical protein
MPDKEVVAVFNEMRALGTTLTDKHERDLADSFFLANEGIHANQWAFVLGALVPAAQNIHPKATYDLRMQLLNGRILVWDIETIHDISGFAAANDLFDRTAEEVRSAMGDKFPKHIYHSIICIGALIAHQDGDYWKVDALGAPHLGDRSEGELIAAFVDRIADLAPSL